MSAGAPPRWLMVATMTMGLIAVASAVLWLSLRQPASPLGQLPGQQTGQLPGQQGSGPGRGIDPELARFKIPEFSLIDQDGQAVDQSIFDGQYTVLDFVFTNCPFVCPGMTGAMAKLQDNVADTRARFVSISVDPIRDTPEALRKFAAEYGADEATWRFLTGSEAEMQKVAGALGMVVQEDPGTPIELGEGETMSNIIHPSRLLLIGPERQLLGLWTFNDAAALADLERTLRSSAGRR